MALERLALTLGETGAVPRSELIRALERAAERLRTKVSAEEVPSDLVSQAEASRAVGVSRQAVNQWVRSSVVRSYAGTGNNSRYGPQVSLAEVAIAANRRSREVSFSAGRRRDLLDFLTAIEAIDATADFARAIRDTLDDSIDQTRSPEHIRVLGEFVHASMGVDDQQREFTADGLSLLSLLKPSIVVDDDSHLGHLTESLRLVVRSNGVAGFDSPSTALLGLLGIATVGAQYASPDADVAKKIAESASDVWGKDWVNRLYDAIFHVGESRPLPLTRYTASLTYLDNNRFLRKAQSAGVSISYSRNPGFILPQRLYGAPIFDDMIHRQRIDTEPWAFSGDAGLMGWPATLDSGVNPFRVFNYEYGFFDQSIHGIRRYCFSTEDVRAELLEYADALPKSKRGSYFEHAIALLTRTLMQPNTELSAVTTLDHFDWWKDHLIRSSPREVLLGLRDERARAVAHALLVSTDFLPQVVEDFHASGSLSDRMRIYVKNLEFDVIDARYRDDIKRGRARLIKAGGQHMTPEEASELAEAEIQLLRER